MKAFTKRVCSSKEGICNHKKTFPWPERRSTVPSWRRTSWSVRSPFITLTSTTDLEDKLSTSAFPSHSSKALGSSWLPASALADCWLRSWLLQWLVNQHLRSGLKKTLQQVKKCFLIEVVFWVIVGLWFVEVELACQWHH